MNVLVTGGSGYIGSHVCVALLDKGFEVTLLDSFRNSSRSVPSRIEAVSGKTINVVEADVRDFDANVAALEAYGCTAVVHLAGLKSVGESVASPLLYYDFNVGGTRALLSAMAQCGVHRFVFSSSATVYGEPKYLPLDEAHPLAPINPYGRTKAVVEGMMGELATSNDRWALASLRYFNPVGAHESGLLGEAPEGKPNNLMPFLADVAKGKRPRIDIFGGDYETPDGTGIRDYIHVVDLANGHLKALEALTPGKPLAVNLGTGRGYSVLEVIASFEAASGRSIPYEIGPRRHGDSAISYADPALASRVLNWRAGRDLDAMSRDTWRWVQTEMRERETQDPLPRSKSASDVASLGRGRHDAAIDAT